MSIELKQALQRLRIVVVDDDGVLHERRLPLGVRSVMGEVCLGSLRDHEHLPILISARQLAARLGKDEEEARAVRRGLQLAEKLGLITRKQPDEQTGVHPAWPIQIHQALITMSRNKSPWAGHGVIFPRAWSEVDPSAPPNQLVTWPVKKAGPVKKTGRKVMEKRSLPPDKTSTGSVARSRPPKRAGVLGPGIPSDRQVRGGSGVSKQTLDLSGAESMNFDQAKMMSRAASVVNLADFVRRGQKNLGRPLAGQDAEVEADGRYWAWLLSSAAAASWTEKKEGQWGGAKAGDLQFFLQKRRRSDDQRGGTFMPLLVSISKAAVGAQTTLQRAAVEAARGQRPETVFQAVGETPLLLIDDLKPAHAQLFSGWRGVAFFETSPDNLQASLMAPRCLLRWETLAVQRALARRCGLALAAVSVGHLRRFSGSKNHKKTLSETFITRLFSEPVPGTMTAEQLADLLAEDAQHAADPVVKTAVLTALKTESVAPVFDAKKVRSFVGPDGSGSAEDWRWIMQRMDILGGLNRDRLIAALVERAGQRQRQGKRADDLDHLRYAQLTVDRALAHRAAKKAACRS